MKTIDYGTVQAMSLGNSTLGMGVPIEWCSHNRLEDGQTLYCTGELSGAITYHTRQRQWAKPVRLSIRAGKYPVLSIPADYARVRGITKGAVIRQQETTKDGALVIELEAAP